MATLPPARARSRRRRPRDRPEPPVARPTRPPCSLTSPTHHSRVASSPRRVPLPSVVDRSSQTEVKGYLKAVYDVEAKRVHTVNYEGKKKRSSNGKNNYFYRRAEDRKSVV